ncbi:MAG: PEP/pyruvate-binding domain-containing protein [Phycisphaerae bacterium]|nr:PEP/pyruvate-binding domain-containing protein [Phycisphaerae bacterium]
MDKFPSTGLDHLDDLLLRLRYGDNVVWQVDTVNDYRQFVIPYVQRAIAEGRQVVYMHFAMHEALLEPQDGLAIVELDINVGFETFSSSVYNTVSEFGRRVFYVFDSLSDLLAAWVTDLMVADFFRVTCPYLYELDTIAYFAILRDHHSFDTIARIRETTQLLLDVYRLEGNVYVHPLKVWNRYSPTMFLPHRDAGTRFEPIGNSVDAARLFTYISNKGRTRVRRKLDQWDQLFLEAEELLAGTPDSARQSEALERIAGIMLGKDQRVLDLISTHFSLRDVLDIKARMIGTGFIGGKAIGMLLARQILYQDQSFDWSQRLENHDSFYIGSDVFHNYIVQNGLWKLRMQQKTKEGYFEKAAELSEGLLKGRFPNEIREQFLEMIEYFGQSPIIIRSSSLLEDGFGNAFAGKYESIFLVNQGSSDERCDQFVEAVRRIYASAMGEDALIYRLQRGLDQQDEQMALLVQRVSGRYHEHRFFPDAAGVGVSYNTFVWNPQFDPAAGMLRMVLGLGTRAVDRVENDYPRLVALDAPLVQPHSSRDNIRQYSQHYMDVLNIETNALETISTRQVLGKDEQLQTELFATRCDAEALPGQDMRSDPVWVLSFDNLLQTTDFVTSMRRMLNTLQAYYEYPVDIEFTLNLPPGGAGRVNLLQCRPLQTRGMGGKVRIPNLDASRIYFEAEGSFMGGNIEQVIHRVIYVDPAGYIALPLQEKYNIARLIGKLNRQIQRDHQEQTLLVGPGRWGTTTPSLGIPVRFSEINNIAVLCELSYPEGNLLPELSYGSHFFQDLVEVEIFYVALFLDRQGAAFRPEVLGDMPNLLTSLVSDADRYEAIVRVVDTTGRRLKIVADITQQKTVCFVAESR